MRKTLSVFALVARATLAKIILLIITLMAGEIGLFYLRLHTQQRLGTLEEMLESSRVYLLFIACFVCIFIILEAFAGKQKGGNPVYTVNRLPIRPGQFTLICSLYNTSCLTLLFAAQIVTDLLLSFIYAEHNTADPYGPVTFLAFYRSDFFHSLLPLGDIFSIFTNVILLVSLGTTCACSAWKTRQGGQDLLAAVLFITAVFPFTQRDIEASVFCNIVILIISFVGLVVSAIKIKKGVMPDED